MSMLPEIKMVDKLDGKDFKLGEFEHDEETGILYVGTHGTVFPGGSSTTGGSGGGSGGIDGGTGEDGGFVSGFKNTEIKYEFKLSPKINHSVEVGFDPSLTANYGFFSIPIEEYSVSLDFNPGITVNYGFVFE